MKILHFITSLGIFFMLCFPAAAQHLHSEKYYQEKWCAEQSGKTEVVMPDRTRCDCLAKTHAIEFDFGSKWAESLGQSMYYSIQTTVGINAKHAPRLELRLQALHTATVIEDMDLPGWKLHSLKGDRAGLWAVSVSENWRIVFEFKDGHAYVVNYEDYH